MGDNGCDVLQSLYDGSAESNIYAGYRDNMADKAGYLVMSLAEGYTVQEACGSSNNAGGDVTPIIPPSGDGSNDNDNSTDGGSADGGAADGGSTDGGSTDGGAADDAAADGGAVVVPDDSAVVVPDDGSSADSGATDGSAAGGDAAAEGDQA